MADREKYIDILSKTVKTVKDFNEDTPIKISLQCVEDILELLKEQEPVEPWLSYDGNEYLFHCTACDAVIYHNGANRDETKAREYAKFCRQCGRAVKWE